MRLLLDTHVVLWQLSGARPLGTLARERIAAATELAFSVVSFAEIGVKAAVGKLGAPADLHARILDAGVRVLGLSPDHGLAVAGLPLHHRDPFDRLLVAQARQDGFTLVTADPRFTPTTSRSSTPSRDRIASAPYILVPLPPYRAVNIVHCVVTPLARRQATERPYGKRAALPRAALCI